MWPIVGAAFVGGLYLASRQIPRTPVRKLECLGPRTGNRYYVEDFEGTTMIAVRKGKSYVVLRKRDNVPGFSLVSYSEDLTPELVQQVLEDFS